MTYDAQSALARILASSVFARAPKLASLLRALVDDYTAGRQESPKEYELGVRAFQRASDYDPQADPIVRVQARQLRLKLHEYYATEGKNDPIRFTLAKGSYLLECHPGATEAPPADTPHAFRARKWLVTAGVVATAVIATGVWIFAGTRKVADERSKVSAAEELYLNGRYYWTKRTPNDLRTALDLFMQAVVKDPGYAKAYVGLADTYLLLREFAGMPDSEAFARAGDAARKAIELDDSLAEAHASLGFCLFHGSLKFAAGLAEFRRAVQLNPNYVTAHHWYANALLSVGNFEEASLESDRARQLDPGSRAILADRGLLQFHKGDVAGSIATLRRVIDAEPAFVSAHSYLARIYLSLHDSPNYLRESRITAQLQADSARISMLDSAEASYRQHGERAMLGSLAKFNQSMYEAGKGGAFQVAETLCPARRQRTGAPVSSARV